MVCQVALCACLCLRANQVDSRGWPDCEQCYGRSSRKSECLLVSSMVLRVILVVRIVCYEQVRGIDF
jgi:hypothetical protein